MFWWILITIAFATLFWSWRILVITGMGAILCYFFLVKKSVRLTARYVSGVALASFALRMMYLGFTDRVKGNLEGALQWIVVEQRSSDTWVIDLGYGSVLLRSKRFLTPGEEVVFQTRMSRAHLPNLSRTDITIPDFVSDEFAFDRRLATKKYLGRWSATAGQVVIIGTQDAPSSIIIKARVFYKARLTHIFGETPTAALMLGMTTGDRSGFSRQIYSSFVESGLVHLLAVSGSNIVYVSLLLGLLLFRVPFYIRVLLISVGLLGYGLFCGADSSVLRAISMGILWLLATWTGRTIWIWRLMQLTAWGMLLRNPLVLWYDLWFLLSFWAVIGIVLVSHGYQLFFTSKNWFSRVVFASWLLPTLWATIGVLPVLILWMGTLSLSSVGINLLVIPLVPIYLLLGGILLLGVDLSPIRRLLDQMSAWLFFLAEWGSSAWLFLSVSAGSARFLFVGLFILLVWRVGVVIWQVYLKRQEAGGRISR